MAKWFRGGPKGRGKRRPVQWVVSTQGYGGSANLISAGLSNGVVTASLVDSSTAPTALGDPALDRFTVFSIVGDYTPVFPTALNASTSIKVDVGIIVIQVGSAAAAQFDPSANADADQSWMLLRHHSFVVANGAQQPTYDMQAQLPMGTHIQTRKLRRIIRPNERLVFLSKATIQAGVPNAGSMNLNLNLRALIGRAI